MTSMFELRDITKSFGTNQVLRGVDLDFEPGRVTALLGANGAGKSTVIKVLSGVHDYGGTISLDGAPVTIDSPGTARRLGIEAVHQKISDGVIPGLSVAANLLFDEIVTNETSRFASSRSLLPKAKEMASILDLGWTDAQFKGDVDDLLLADQQLLLLARALVRKPRLLILDEPTSALSKSEADRLFEVIEQLTEAGVGVFYVSHRLREIDRIADELVVLRDGQIRGRYEPPFEWSSALDDMLGQTRAETEERNDEMQGTADVLQLQGVQLLPKSDPIDVTFRAGEVTGVFGLLGAGKTELASGMFGAAPFKVGAMTLNDSTYAPRSPASAIKDEVFMVPEDRAAGTLVGDWSIARTSSLPFLSAVSSLGILNAKSEQDVGETVIRDFGVVANSAKDPVISLSGGNQQKVVVGRWLKEQPVVMILDEPFQGVDIGARHDLVVRVREVAKAGSAVVLMTSDLEEIMQAADRVLVLVDGEIQHDVYLSQTSREEILDSLVTS